MKDLYDSTMEISKRYVELNYKLVEIWECDELFNTIDFKSFVLQYDSGMKHKLIPRDAFFGGRTNCTKLYYKCKPGEVIKYIDVCSLYPTVMFLQRK